MTLVSRSMIGAKYDGHTSRATRSRMVAKVPGVPKAAGQRLERSAGTYTVTSIPLHLGGELIARAGDYMFICRTEGGACSEPSWRRRHRRARRRVRRLLRRTRLQLDPERHTGTGSRTSVSP